MADEQILASVSAVSEALDTDMGGPYIVHGYDPVTKKLILGDYNAFVFGVDLDGSNPVELKDSFPDSNHDPGQGDIYNGLLYQARGAYNIYETNLLTGFERNVFAAGSSRDGVLTRYDYINNHIYALWNTNNIEVHDLNAGTSTSTVFESATGFVRFDIAPELELSDASTGAMFYFDAGSIKLLSLANHVNETADQLNTWDLTSGSFPGTYVELIDLRYDRENGQIYILIDEGSDVHKLYVAPGTEDGTVADFQEVGTVSTTADQGSIGFATQIVLVYDSYPDFEEAGAIGDIPGLVLWLDAADALDAGAATPDNAEAVASWPDQSSAGNDPTAMSGVTYVTSDATLNNLPAVHFDGVDDYIQLPDSVVGVPTTIFMVVKGDATASGYFAFFGEGGVNTPLGLQDGGGDLDIVIGATSTDGPAYTRNAGDVIEYRFAESGTSTGWYRRSNSASHLIVTGTGSLLPQPEDMNPQVIGGRENTLPTIEVPWEGLIAEIIVFNRSLNNFESQEVRDLLNTKYDL